MDCGGILIGIEFWQQFESRETCITITNLSKELTNNFFELNSFENQNTPNLHDGMKNLINNESIDQNDICASGIQAKLMDSYGLEVSKVDAEAYCKCVFEGLAARDYELDINKSAKEQTNNPNSSVYNEVSMICVKPLLESMGILGKKEYNDDDILGDLKMSKVQILKDINESLKLKITIGGIEKYFQFDTGASHLIIDGKMERDLLARNIIRESDYLGSSNVTIADNTVVKCKVVNLSQIKIGDYFVNNVETLIIEEGALLCGLSLLEKFRTYNFNSSNNILTIER